MAAAGVDRTATSSGSFGRRWTRLPGGPLPCLLPREPYEISNRWEEYGSNLFRLQDRRGADMLLAPMHEEMFALMVKDLYSCSATFRS